MTWYSSQWPAASVAGKQAVPSWVHPRVHLYQRWICTMLMCTGLNTADMFHLSPLNVYDFKLQTK
jgi:hypothetical protein